MSGPAGRPALAAEEVIALLGLQPLPDEGGMWAQLHRDDRSTAIWFLLRPGDFSALHRLAGPEVYHRYAGAPAELVELDADGGVRRTVLGEDLRAGQRPAAVVQAGVWQGSRTLGDWSLLGTTMAPGFTPQGFELGDRASLQAAFPAHAALVAELTRS